RVIVGDFPICDNYTRTVNASGHELSTTPLIDGLKPLREGAIRYNTSTKRISIENHGNCTLNVKTNIWNNTLLGLNVTCTCLNTDDVCINMTRFGDMTMCPDLISDPADRYLYEESHFYPFAYSSMRKTQSCRFVYTSSFDENNSLNATRLVFSECNDQSTCDKWDNLTQELPLESDSHGDWRGLKSLKCAFTSIPGECPLAKLSDIKAPFPRNYTLECRCEDGFCALRAATFAFGAFRNLLFTSSVYYGRSNGTITDRYVLEGMNAMPIHLIASNGSRTGPFCELAMYKISNGTTGCSEVTLNQRTYANFSTLLRPMVNCVCHNSPTDSCFPGNETYFKETATGLLSLIGQCRNSSQFLNYWRYNNTAEDVYPKDRNDWGPGDVVLDDLFICGQDVHTINYDPKKPTEFGYLVKKSSLANFPRLGSHITYNQMLSCEDHFHSEEGDVTFCTCFGVNRTCNEWPELFGTHYRKLMTNYSYTVKRNRYFAD
ncbi:hypothetical protein AAVH_43500, partial [Aphelenchoides avenae]